MYCEGVFKKLAGIGKVYLCGGAVRDILLGETPRDCDFCVIAGDVGEVVSKIREKLGREILALERNGKVLLYPDFDVRVVKERGNDELRLALSSDFTVNSLLMDVGGRVIDPLGVIDHVKQRVIYPVRDNLFVKEPRTILRAYRLSTTRGMKVPLKTEQLIHSVSEGVVSSIDPQFFFFEFRKAYEESPECGLRFFRRLIREGIIAKHNAFSECPYVVAGLRGYKQRFRWRVISEYPAEFVYATFFISARLASTSPPEECLKLLPEMSQLIIRTYVKVARFGVESNGALKTALEYGDLLEVNLFRNFIEAILPKRLKNHVEYVLRTRELIFKCRDELFPGECIKDVMRSRTKKHKLRMCVINKFKVLYH